MIKRFPIQDETGALNTLFELVDEIKMNNISALAIVFTRKKDGSTCTYKNGCDRINLLGTLQQLAFDTMSSGEFKHTGFDKKIGDDKNE